MGTNLLFMSAAAATAGTTPPPAARMPTAANCADPAKTTADMTTAASAGKPRSVATTPKDRASTPEAPA
jgi:hypothetical protein